MKLVPSLYVAMAGLLPAAGFWSEHRHFAATYTLTVACSEGVRTQYPESTFIVYLNVGLQTGYVIVVAIASHMHRTLLGALRIVWISVISITSSLYATIDQVDPPSWVRTAKIVSVVVIAVVGVALVVVAFASSSISSRRQPIVEAVILGGAICLRFDADVRDATNVEHLGRMLWLASLWLAGFLVNVLPPHDPPRSSETPSPDPPDATSPTNRRSS